MWKDWNLEVIYTTGRWGDSCRQTHKKNLEWTHILTNIWLCAVHMQRGKWDRDLLMYVNENQSGGRWRMTGTECDCSQCKCDLVWLKASNTLFTLFTLIGCSLRAITVSRWGPDGSKQSSLSVSVSLSGSLSGSRLDYSHHILARWRKNKASGSTVGMRWDNLMQFTVLCFPEHVCVCVCVPTAALPQHKLLILLAYSRKSKFWCSTILTDAHDDKENVSSTSKQLTKRSLISPPDW